MARYYEDARRLAHMLTKWSIQIPARRHRFVVTTGGGPGIMEAANLGAHEAGGKTIGLNINLPFEQNPNPYITPSLNFEFHYFFMRKFWFAYLAKALVIFPGGFGTMDELFEILTLAQTEKLAKKILVVIYGSEYWNKIINFQAFVDAGTDLSAGPRPVQDRRFSRRSLRVPARRPDQIPSGRRAEKAKRSRPRNREDETVDSLRVPLVSFVVSSLCMTLNSEHAASSTTSPTARLSPQTNPPAAAVSWKKSPKPPAPESTTSSSAKKISPRENWNRWPAKPSAQSGSTEN